MLQTISEAEKLYIQVGCDEGVRFDGRDADSFRSITIENNVFPHLHGSSRFKIHDTIDILCSIKLEIVETKPLLPKAGYIEVSTEISPSCFITMDSKALKSYSTLISEQIQSIIVRSSVIDLNILCIIPNKHCWCIHIDFLILQIDGNPLEHCSIASFIALQCTKIPKTELIIGDSGTYEDFDVVGDLSQCLNINLNDMPICITIVKVGSALLIDASAEEQQCATCILSIAIDRHNNCCALTYLKHGLLHEDELYSCIEKASIAASAIYKHIDAYLNIVTERLIENISHNKNHSICPDHPPKRYGLLA